jgi:hypothetical protein
MRRIHYAALAKWIVGCGLLYDLEIMEFDNGLLGLALDVDTQVILGYTCLSLMLTAKPYSGESWKLAWALGESHVRW